MSPGMSRHLHPGQHLNSDVSLTGSLTRSSARAKKLLPAGAVLWAWDADPDFDEKEGEQWLVLLPKKWNPSKHTQVYSWRYDPRELGAARASAPDPRRRDVVRDMDDSV